MNWHIQYLTDEHGVKTAVQIPLQEWQQLVEEYNNLKVHPTFKKRKSTKKRVERHQQVQTENTIKEESAEYLRAQVSSRAYQEWLSAENDIYDEVFGNEIE